MSKNDNQEPVSQNLYQTPDSGEERQEQELMRHRRYRKTLVYLKKMHDNPSGYRRSLRFKSFMFLGLAVVLIMAVQSYSEVELDLYAILGLVGFSMFMHVSQLCRLAHNSLELNMHIIDWEMVEALLEEDEVPA